MSTADRAVAAAEVDHNDTPENRAGLKKVVAASMAGTVVEVVRVLPLCDRVHPGLRPAVLRGHG